MPPRKRPKRTQAHSRSLTDRLGVGDDGMRTYTVTLGGDTTGTVPEPPALTTAGALPLGTATYAIPTGAIYVHPTAGDDAGGSGAVDDPFRTLARALQSTTANGTIVLRGGEYHEGGTSNYSTGVLVAETTHNGVTIQNYPGEVVWFDGSSIVTGWVADGARWRLDNWTKRFPYDYTFSQNSSVNTGDSFVRPDYPAAHMPDQLFLDGVPQQQVTSLAGVTAGTFYLDTATSRVYMGSNPTGRETRMSDRNRAITMAGIGSTLRGVGVRRYGNPLPDQGAVQLVRADVTLENCVIEYNATSGLFCGYRSGQTLRNCTVAHNGLIGLNTYQADDLTIDACLFEYNNAEHFDAAPVAGGLKLDRLQRPTVSNCVVRYNIDSAGVWADEAVYDFAIVSNDIYDNDTTQIQVEISGLGVIADNLCRGGVNGFNLVSTNNIRCWNNTLIDHAVEPFKIVQDNRTPDNAPRDNRQTQTFYDTLCTYLITEFQWKNNVIGRSSSAAMFRIKCYDYSQFLPVERVPGYGWDDMGIDSAGNLYNRASGPPGQLFSAFADTGVESFYADLTAVRAALTGLEVDSVEIAGSDAFESDWTLTSAALTAVSGIGAALPSDIAALIGQTAGDDTQIGCWR